MFFLKEEIFARVWAIFGILIISIFLVIYITTCYVGLKLYGKKAEKPLLVFGYHRLVKSISSILCIRYQIKGQEKFQKNKAYVLVSNHRSMLDIFANQYASPIPFKFLSKIENEKIPLFGYIIRKLCIPINRKSKESRQESMALMKNCLLEDGLSVLLYPEGTRNRTQEPLQAFYDGAFRLAIETETPIMVQTLLNTKAIVDPQKGWKLFTGKIECFWDEPIETKGMSLGDIERLKSKVKEIMLKHLATK